MRLSLPTRRIAWVSLGLDGENLAVLSQSQRIASAATGSKLSFRDFDSVGDHTLGDISHRKSQIHRGLLDPPEGIGLAHAQRLLDDRLGPVDLLAGLEPLGEVGDLGLELPQLGEPGPAISTAGTRSRFSNGLTR